MSGCRPAGLLLHHLAPVFKEGVAPALLDHTTLHDVTPLPEIAGTRFCADPSGSVRRCQTGGSNCAAGQMPNLASGCQSVGVPWICPPGFVVDDTAALAPGDLFRCAPDPADCGGDPFGGVQPGPGRFFVRASAAAGGNGSRDAPFRQLKDAIKAAGSGDLIALAAGAYSGPLKLAVPLTLRGRCAALVIIDGDEGAPAITAVHQGKGTSSLSGLTLTGAGGLNVQGQSTVIASRLWVRDAAPTGVLIHGALSSLTVSDAVIDNAGSKAHAAVQVLSGGEVHLENVRISRARGTGLMAHQAGSRVTADNLMIANSRAWKEQFGTGAEFGEAATGKLVGVRVTGNRATGLMVEGAGTRLEARGLVVDGTRATELVGFFGMGLVVRQGAQFDGAGVRLSDNTGAGIAIDGKGTLVTVDGLVVDGTAAAANLPHAGVGIMLGGGARTELHSARLSGNRAVGLWINATGTSASARDLVVDATRPDMVDGTLGIGIDVFGGAALSLEGGRLHRNRAMGLRVRHAGSRATLTDMLIDATQPELATGGLGLGVDVDEGARVVLRASRLHDNRGAGLRANDVGTSARVEGSLLDGTRTTGWPASGGSGIDVSRRAVVHVVGSRMVGNRTAGLLVTHVGSRARLVGSSIEHSLSSAGAFGVGLGAIDQGGLEAISTSLVGNRGVGIHIDRGKATLTGVVVADTRSAPMPRLRSGGGVDVSGTVDVADGILARSVQGLLMVDSLAVKQERTGWLVDGGSDLRIEHSCATGSLFGLATQSSPKLQLQAVLLFDNETNIGADRQLALPRPPTPLPD